MSSTLYVRNGYGVRGNRAREFDTLVKAAFGAQAVPARGSASPAAESYRDGDDAVVRLEIPGVVVDDVQVEVVGGRLVISGERRDDVAEESAASRVGSFRYGEFKRAFRLGRQVTAEQVSASYDAGVLTVRVADAYAAPEGQRIAISTTPVVAGEVDEA